MPLGERMNLARQALAQGLVLNTSPTPCWRSSFWPKRRRICERVCCGRGNRRP